MSRRFIFAAVPNPFATSALWRLPIILAAVGVLVGGFFLLYRSEAEARDTIRKHHLQDIEDALYFAYNLHGTYPPYDAPTWCGVLQDPASAPVREQIEAALRQQNEKYANADKPFPNDPLLENVNGLVPRRADQTEDIGGYFYWKRSPAVFELYSKLEMDATHDRSTQRCPEAAADFFDYGINSRLRANPVSL